CGTFVNMLSNAFNSELRIHILGLLIAFPRLRSQPLFVLRLDLFPTIEKALDRTRPGGLTVKNVEHRFDRTQHDMQRNPASLPAFDHCPVKRRKKEMLSSSANERVLDLCVVIEIIHAA